MFIQTNGDEFHASAQKIKGPIAPNQEVSVTVTMYAPEVPGNYIAFFRFVHGDNNRFGQKVWCDILVQPNPIAQPMKFIEVKEERSSLLNESMQMEQPIYQHQQQPIPQLDIKLEAEDLKLSQYETGDKKLNIHDDFIEMVANDNFKPANDLALSVYDEVKPPVQEEVKQREVVENLKVSQPSAEELEKIQYLEKVETLKDPKLIDNMKQLLDMGFTNFEVNLNLLRRNNNDFVLAANSICNGLVTDSMFIAK